MPPSRRSTVKKTQGETASTIRNRELRDNWFENQLLPICVEKGFDVETLMLSRKSKKLLYCRACDKTCDAANELHKFRHEMSRAHWEACAKKLGVPFQRLQRNTFRCELCLQYMSRQDSLTRHREGGGCPMMRGQSSSRSPEPVSGPSGRVATRERAAKTKANAALKQYKIDYAEVLPLEMTPSQSASSSSTSPSPSPSPPLLTPPLSPPSTVDSQVWSPKLRAASIDDYASLSGSLLGSVPSADTPLLFLDDSQPAATSGLFYDSQPSAASGLFYDSQPSATSSLFYESQPSTTSNLFYDAQPSTTPGLFYDYHDPTLSDLTEELLSGSLNLGFQDMGDFAYPGLDLSVGDQPLAPFDFAGFGSHLPLPDMLHDLGPGYDPSRGPDLSFGGYLQAVGRLDEYPGEWNQ